MGMSAFRVEPKTWNSPDRVFAACTPVPAAYRLTSRFSRSDIALETPIPCCSGAASHWKRRRFSSAFASNSRHEALGAADYNLIANVGGRDLFTFCMCAGGYVMPSVSEPGYFCTNGMSESRHDSPFANSGLVMTITPEDTGSRHPLAGVHYQQRAERLAYLAGGRRYQAPIQWTRDFLADRPSRGKVPSSYPRGVAPVDMGLILPPLVLETLERGLPILDRRFGGLFLRDSTLTGPESRGSSPVRIPRDSRTRESPTVAGLYPCGEGAGYAGGIISAAVDGLRTARAIVGRFARPS